MLILSVTLDIIVLFDAIGAMLHRKLKEMQRNGIYTGKYKRPRELY